MSVVRCDLGLFHQKFDLVNFIFRRFLFDQFVYRCVITSYDLHFGGFTACLVIDDTVSGHVDTHISR